MASRAPVTRALPKLRDLSLSDLDGDLSVFPLPGALLLPHGRLPLNVFEPRYVSMIDDALRSRRLIGIVQPQGLEAYEDDQDMTEPDVESSAFAMRSTSPMIARDVQPVLYHVGCAGRITSFIEREDGTYAVTLLGVARFQIRQELEPVQGYRRVKPDFASYAGDLVDAGPIAFERDALMTALRRFFMQRGFEARWEAIEQMDDETLIITLSMICPFPVAEKQALLEAHTVSQRARTLLALLQMAGHETEDGRKPHPV